MESWAVACTLKEPVETVKAFVAHYLSLGAKEIHLFFDDPRDPAFEAVAWLPQVFATRCDAQHWETREKGRSDDHRKRQVHNVNLAYAKCSATWLAHFDADEFLICDGPVDEMLAAAHGAAPIVQIRPVERVFREAPQGDAPSFEGPFRKLCDKSFAHGLLIGSTYGDRAPLFRRGILSHIVGKPFVRTGKNDMQIGLHEVHRPNKDNKVITNRVYPENAILLHFDAVSYECWLRKFRKRAYDEEYLETKKGPRLRQFQLFREVEEAEGEIGLRKLFADLYVLTEERATAMTSHGLLLEYDLQLPERTEQIFGAGALQAVAASA